MSLIFRTLYLFVVQPIALFLLVLFSFFNAKVKRGFQLRRQYPLSSIPKDLNPIWFHCASGEFEYIAELIRKYKIKDPHTKILVTYFSPSFYKTIKNNPNVDYSCPLPFDLPGPLQSFILRIKPKLIVIARTDLWPECLYQCKKHNVPTVLVSRTQKKITGINRIANPIRKYLLNQINEVYAVSGIDKKNLLDINPNLSIKVTGDTRYDQVLYKLSLTNDKLKQHLKPKNSKPTVILGSTWPEDEAIVLPALLDSLKNKQVNLIIAPHEPTEKHIQSIIQWLENQSLQHLLYTQTDSFIDGKILIIDTVGVLAHLYQWSNFAFIGGSFKANTHSVMEALATGNFVFVGPKNKNNREAQEFKNIDWQYPVNPVTEVNDKNDIIAWLNLALEHSNETQKQQIKNLVISKSNASEKVFEYLKAFTAK